jgi:membrane protease subunit (stomatin/prohibitin family)
MAFFKDLGKKITEGVQDASEKASELVEVNKLNFAISKEKGAIDDIYQQIGAKVFGMYQAGEIVPGSLSDEFNTISAHLQTIAGYEAKISEIKGEPVAQPQAAPTAAPPTPTPAAAPADASAARFCGNCGAKLNEGSAFCGECGQKA